MDEIKISVIVPIYNVQEYLSQCIDSLLDQAIDLELILIDDGSTDDSGSIAGHYAKKDHRIKIIHQQNQGLPAARNAGLEKATGRYIAFVNSDDFIKKDSLCTLYQEIHTNNADIVMANAISCYSDGSTVTSYNIVTEATKQSVLSGKQCYTQLMKGESFPPMVYCYMYKREYLERLKIKFEDVLHEDELWTPIVLIQAERAIITGLDFYHYRLRNDSIVHTSSLRRKAYSLFYIVTHLIDFANCYRFDEENLEVKSWLYVKIFSLYSRAFSWLPKIKDTSFMVPEIQMADFWSNFYKIPDEAKEYCQNDYRDAEKMMDEYFSWKRSEWVTSDRIQNNSGKKMILVYNTMWNIPLSVSLKDISSDYIITTDRKYLTQADAIVFHLPDLYKELEHDLNKPEKQIWIAWNLECEENYQWTREPEFAEMFDLWMNYRQDADIVYPYYQYNYPKLLQSVSMVVKKKIDKACMFISSRINQSKRIEYLEELVQYLEIDSYGQFLNNKQLTNDYGRSSKMHVFSNYKFVISFENAVGEDYVTEKFYDPLLAGTVPVYLGAPNIDKFVPGENCFVDVRKFENPKALADFLNNCFRDDDMYLQFFDWKNNPERLSFLKKTEQQKINPFVRLCTEVSRILENR